MSSFGAKKLLVVRKNDVYVLTMWLAMKFKAVI